MQAAVRASLSVKIDIPIYVLMPTLANLFIRELESCGSWLSVPAVVEKSITAKRLRDKPVQTLVELTARLEKPLPNKVRAGLTLLLCDVVRSLKIKIPEHIEDIEDIDNEHFVDWLKWVIVWFLPSS